MKNTHRTAERLLAHYHAYPCMTLQDLCKFLHQSTFGCEHIVTDEPAAIARICEEMDGLCQPANSMIEPLDGNFRRGHLG